MNLFPTLAVELTLGTALGDRGAAPERLEHHERWALLLWSALPHLAEEARRGGRARAAREAGMAALMRGLLAWDGCRVDDVDPDEADADEELMAAAWRSLGS